MKVEFKVAMDAEAKANKEFHNVVLEIDMDSATREQLEAYALRAYKVELQGQIRPNWDSFIKDEYPKTLVFGQGLFASKRGAPVTIESAAAKLKVQMESMTMEEKMNKLKELGLI